MTARCSAEIQRLVKSQLAAAPELLYSPRVVDSGRGIERQREEGCVTGDHQPLALVPFQSHQGYTECLVLISSMLVEVVITGLRNSPGNVVLPSKHSLLLHCAAAALREQAEARRSHQDAWHEVLERGCTPRQQHAQAFDARQRPSKVNPVLRWHISFCDSDETCKTRFGCEQVVVTGVEFGGVHPVADMKEMAFAVIEKAEVRLPYKAVQFYGQRLCLVQQRSNSIGCIQ